MRSVNQRLALILCFCFFIWLAAAASAKAMSAANEEILFDDPVKVVVSLDRESGDGYFLLKLDVIFGKERFPIQSALIGLKNFKEAVDFEKKRSGWKGPYLFVREECGGGNAWRCNLEHIYKIVDKHLIYIGATYAGESDTPGSSYQNGVFIDIYDKLEINTLTGHVDAPGLWLVIKEKNGKMVVDLDQTWIRNKKDYDTNQSEIQAGLKKKTNSFYLLSPLLFNAVLAKYCAKKDQLKTSVKIAGTILDVNRFHDFQKILSEVMGGEIPRKTE
jgi:hypothetical protein